MWLLCSNLTAFLVLRKELLYFYTHSTIVFPICIDTHIEYTIMKEISFTTNGVKLKHMHYSLTFLSFINVPFLYQSMWDGVAIVYVLIEHGITKGSPWSRVTVFIPCGSRVEPDPDSTEIFSRAVQK